MTIVSVIQTGAVFGDMPQTLARIERLTAEAAAQGAKLAVFPEALLGGYPLGMDFGAIGKRGTDSRRRFHDFTANAPNIPGDTIQAVAAIAQKHALYIVIGVVEREVGSVFNSALVIGPDGKPINLHRALTVAPSERALWRLGDGAFMQAANSPIGTIGALIRDENYMPAARLLMYDQDVQIYCALTVEDGEAWISSMQHIAREGGCFVLSSCQFLTKQDFPEGWFGEDDESDILIRGGSCIVHPSGRILAGPLYDQESVLTADIDLGAVVERRSEFNVSGDAARADIFNMIFNHHPQRSITMMR